MLAASSKAETLPLFPTHFLGEVGIDWGTMAAASAFIMLPALIVVFCNAEGDGEGPDPKMPSAVHSPVREVFMILRGHGVTLADSSKVR